MHPLLKILIGLPLVVYYVIEGIILSVIPKKLRYKNINGETVLITGAGGGIGRELALAFAKCGTKLILLDINFKLLNETQEVVSKRSSKSAKIFLYECDVSNRNAVYSVATKIKNEVGTVNILVNNAGVITDKTFLDCPDDMIQKTMDVNVMAHFWMCKAFLPDMKKANHGHIISIASLAGFLPSPFLTGYSTSKFAAVGFEESLGLELQLEGYTGIKTTVVAPYFVQTNFIKDFDLGFMPPLCPNMVAKQVVSAVLVDQEVVVIPVYFQVLMILKALLPRKASQQFSVLFTYLCYSTNFTKRITKTD